MPGGAPRRTRCPASAEAGGERGLRRRAPRLSPHQEAGDPCARPTAATRPSAGATRCPGQPRQPLAPGASVPLCARGGHTRATDSRAANRRRTPWRRDDHPDGRRPGVPGARVRRTATRLRPTPWTIAGPQRLQQVRARPPARAARPTGTERYAQAAGGWLRYREAPGVGAGPAARRHGQGPRVRWAPSVRRRRARRTRSSPRHPRPGP